VTLFDLIAAAIILISGVIGFVRGAVREMITVGAFILSAIGAVLFLPYAGPVFRHFITPGWAAGVVGVAAVFLVIYIVLRVLGAMIVAKLHMQPALGAADRAIGVGFGVVRALIFLGLFYLVFNAATPREWTPDWIAKAKLYPVAEASADLIRSFAPKGMDAAGRFKPKLESAVEEGFTGKGGKAQDVAPGARIDRENSTATSKKLHNSQSYGKSQRDSIDALVERSR